MANIYLLYGSTEGQTAKVATFLAEKLWALGDQVTLVEAGDRSPLAPLPGTDMIVVAASLHLGTYQPAVEDWVRRHPFMLSALKNLFISVSLSAAGDDPADRRGLTECVLRFMSRTGWTPEAVEHVAGAFHFSRYTLLQRLAMRWIGWRRGQRFAKSGDVELTDWNALKVLAERIHAQVHADSEPEQLALIA